MKVEKYFWKTTNELRLLLKTKTDKRDQAQHKVDSYDREIRAIENILMQR